MRLITDKIRSIVSSMALEDIKADYKKLVSEFASQAKEYAIDRDGDLYQASCPVCKTKLITPVGSGIFVCKKKHVFHVYTEDGIRELPAQKDPLGPDLQDDGKDSHGHSPYTVYDPDEKSPVFLSYWIHFERVDLSYRPNTIEDISQAVWALRNSIPLMQDMYLHYYVEVDTMAGGSPVAEIGSHIKTWPEYMNNRKWFLVLNAIKGTEWNLGIIQEGER